MNAANCKYCLGYSDWSGNGPSTPPECDIVFETRTPGSCIDGGAGNCVETPITTTRSRSYTPFLSESDKDECDFLYGMCMIGCMIHNSQAVCEQNWCGPGREGCYDEHKICVQNGSVEGNSQTGCQ